MGSEIVDVVLAPGLGGSFFDDHLAVRSGAERDGMVYRGEPMLPGFTSVRQPGQAVSVMLLLDDGYVAHGDCVAVQYAGFGGRDAPFRAEALLEEISEHVVPRLVGRPATDFRALSEELDRAEADGRRLHTAIRYGVSQALLDAAAWCARVTMAERVQLEYGLEGELREVPIFCQSGSDWNTLDSMVIKEVPVLPHGLINNIEDHVGRDGEKLLDYVTWVSRRVRELRGSSDYHPVVHLDVYGTIGLVFDGDIERIASYLGRLADAASPFSLQVEGAIDAGGQEQQVRMLGELRSALRQAGIPVAVIADEWCNTLDDVRAFVDAEAVDMIQVKTPDLGSITNTVEALIYCRDSGVGAYSGGSANETDRSAQVSTHIAVACEAAQCLAKPGLGVDEPLMVVQNEMSRLLALARHRADRTEEVNGSKV